MVCPGSVALSRGIANTKSSQAADEGTMAHTVAEHLFRHVLANTKKPCVLPAIHDSYDKNMVGDCKSYTEEVLLLEGELHIEVELDFKKLHPGLGGTSDLVNIDRANRILRVGDLKYGRTPVSAKENTQLLQYAVGAVETFNLHKDIDTIELLIFQPRGKNSEWKTTMTYLKDFTKRLVAAAKATDDPFAPLVMTDKGCYWCKAKARCPEFAKVAKKTAQTDFGTPAPKANTPSQFTLEKLVDVLPLAAQLAPWCEAVFLQAKDELATDPASIPGWGLKPGAVKRSWAEDTAIMELVQRSIEQMPQSLRDQALVSLITEPEVVSPAKFSAALDDLMANATDNKILTLIDNLKLSMVDEIVSKPNAPSLVKVKPKA